MPTPSELLQKVSNEILSICGIEFDFAGQLVPSFSEASQNFFDSANPNANWIDTYFSKSSLKFSEESKTEKAGIKYVQSLIWSFPNNDHNRSIRINELHKVKYIKLVLTDHSRIVLGRNDFFQNTPPSVRVVSNVNKTEVTFSVASIFPFGFLESLDQGGFFPVDIPITFINL